MIKVMHCADLHLGYRQYGFAIREGDFYKAAQQVFTKAVEHKVQAILIAGDLFDSTKPPAAAVWIVQRLVQYANQNGVRVIGIDGNHDASDNNWLRICGIESLDRNVLTIEKDGLALNVAGINGTRPSAFFNQVQAFQAAGYKDIHVFAVHQAVMELCDFPTKDFSAAQIATAVKPLGVQYVALGDIHAYRETVINGVRFAYPGSTEVNAIDEATNKSVNLILWDGNKLQTSIIPIETRPFVVCSLEVESDLDRLLALTRGENPPFLLGWYKPEQRDLVKRAETLLRDANCMYRFMPYAGMSGKKGLELAQRSFERKGALLQLKDAVTTYFEENSDEYQLVFQLLGAPDNTRGIVEAYCKSKGIE